MKSLLLFLVLIFFGIELSNACTIFMANDGRNVWIGNNEDEDSSLSYRLWYFPATGKSYGYMIWTELSVYEKINSLMYKNPQGGMNEHGLFLDYTAIDAVPASHDPKKQNREEEVVTYILRNCKTVKEALKFISKFNLTRLTGAQLFIGDASGDYATVHGSFIERKTTDNFTLTNYCIKNGHHETCWRRDAANDYLGKNNTYALQNIVTILQRTAQKKPSNIVTNYSMAVELKKKSFHLYYKNDFKTPVIISLAEELKKGKHFQDMASYFPKSISEIILDKYSISGIDGAILVYDSLRKYHPKEYNFNNHDGIELGIQAIAIGKASDGIHFLECLKKYEPEDKEIDTWLGVAYRKEGRIEESNHYFAKVFGTDPENYVAVLLGKQQNQTVTFQINDFEGAEQVLLSGDFSDWKPISMQKINNRWICTFTLPKGEYRYKFIVNGIYLADQLNLLYTGSGPYINSILYVW
ncbi:putative choloylglycine hydrolase [Flavobacterium sp. 28YEA47A]|uniref:carcinine hydrolase/isopenicillin-N N-acyltransferase family protein n=1 Tax=Flavobacterium sp. 28YEA47A TaxID=3156276 RepID=UPI003512B427